MPDDLIGEIQDKNIPVSVLLMKAKIMANKLGQEDFLTWVELEMNGYKENGHCPTYRHLTGQVKFWNPMLGWCPIVFETSETEKSISIRSTYQSAETIEVLLSTNSPQYEIPLPASLANQIMRESGMQTKVSLMIDRSSLAEILNKVRNLLLDWVLKLEKENLKEEKVILIGEEIDNKKLKFNLSFSTKDATMLLKDQDNNEYEIKIQGQVQKEVLRVIFQNPKDVYTTWSLYDISDILGRSDVNEKSVHDAIYQFNKKVQLSIQEVKNLFELTKHSAKLNSKYVNKT